MRGREGCGRCKPQERPSQSWRSDGFRAPETFVQLADPGPCERIKFGFGEYKGGLGRGVIWEAHGAGENYGVAGRAIADYIGE
jgi:hypothetical protein